MQTAKANDGRGQKNDRGILKKTHAGGYAHIRYTVHSGTAAGRGWRQVARAIGDTLAPASSHIVIQQQGA
jgi:hypothetical protein